jgi:hypothetical protein
LGYRGGLAIGGSGRNGQGIARKALRTGFKRPQIEPHGPKNRKKEIFEKSKLSILLKTRSSQKTNREVSTRRQSGHGPHDLWL